MTYQLILTGKFKKGLKRAKKRGLNIALLDSIVDKLIHGQVLDEKYKDHELKGKYSGFRECHLQPDWLLLYLLEDDILTLTLVETGTHSDLFDI
jgi:mRNA interferase YafQ